MVKPSIVILSFPMSLITASNLIPEAWGVNAFKTGLLVPLPDLANVIGVAEVFEVAAVMIKPPLGAVSV